MIIYNAEQLYLGDQITIKNQQLGPTDLMERAGQQVFQWLHSRMQGAQVPIRVFCGIGNNGGDGLVLSRQLVEHGYNVHTYVVNCSDKRSKNFLINYDRIKQVTKKWPTLIKSEDDFPEIHRDDVVVDAIFGIGLNRCLSGWVKALTIHMNTAGAFILAIDIPSGLYPDGPIEDPEAIVKANHTLTFQFPKLSFFMPSTGIYTQTWEALDIGIDPEFVNSTKPLANLLGRHHILSWYVPREKYAHKGTYGHTLIIGGSYGKVGATILASQGALRIGSGLVSAYVPKCGVSILQSTVVEAMVIADPNEHELTSIPQDLENYTLVVGMGMGTSKATQQNFEALLKAANAPLVLDADAINCLAAQPELLKEIPKGSVLTPHPGELNRLLGDWKDDFDKLAKAQQFVNTHHVVLLIKGAHTMVLFGDTIFVNATGNPGMATAGSGDVLAGAIGGLMAQNYESWQAALIGVYLHGSAGDIAVQSLGYQALTASDLVQNFGPAFIALFKPDEPANAQQAQESQEAQ